MFRKLRIGPGRCMGIMIATGILVVLLSWAAVVLATDITADGNCSEWAAADWIDDDGDEPSISNEYDFDPIYATINTAETQFFFRYNTISNTMVQYDSYTRAYFDIDDDPATGYAVDCHSGTIGAERRLVWDMDDETCNVYGWDGSGWTLIDNDCVGAPGGYGQKSDTCVEIGADTADLGFGSSDHVAVQMHFENGVPSSDDEVCFGYGSGTTDVELSSFSACSERTSANKRGSTSLWPVALLSGLMAVSAGGFIVWKRRELAP
jgi:hypothetical protein